LKEWEKAAPSPSCAARVSEPTNPAITSILCEAVHRSPPHFSDPATLVCCCCLHLWPIREAPALRKTCNQLNLTAPCLHLLSLSTLCPWWQAVAGSLGVTSSIALRSNSWCTWRPSEGARNGDNIAIRRACSPWRPGGNGTAEGHGCPRGVAPLRPPLASRDTSVAHTGGATTPSPHHAS
jgi:hypothetical protein